MKWWLPTVAVVLLLSVSPPARSQQIVFDFESLPRATGGGFWPTWDPFLERVIFRRDVKDTDEAALLVVPREGQGLAICTLGDFSGASRINIWDAQGSPNGEVIASAVVTYDSRERETPLVKQLLLAYRSDGTLRKAWDSNPYHHHLVSGDSEGNIFALGDADDMPSDYPLLVKYSPQGQVVAAFLPATTFPRGDQIFWGAGQKGQSQMFVKQGRLFLYVAATQEFFSFSLQGQLQSRVSLASAFDRIAEKNEAVALSTYVLSVDSRGDIIVQVGLFKQEPSKSNLYALARIAPDGTLKSTTVPGVAATAGFPFLGLTTSDTPVYEEPYGSASVRVDLANHRDLP